MELVHFTSGVLPCPSMTTSALLPVSDLTVTAALISIAESILYSPERTTTMRGADDAVAADTPAAIVANGVSDEPSAPSSPFMAT